jgi:competence ComEA-like helix-hairpin-helix protein
MDFSWRPFNLAVMLVLLIAAGAAMAWQTSRSVVNATDEIPVTPSRVAQGLDRIDPNTACYASLRRVPGVGPVKAQAIIDWRQQHKDQPFQKAENLDDVPGIGPVLVRKMAPFLNLPSSTPPDESDDDSAWQDESARP